MLFSTTFSLEVEGPLKNWYPDTKTFVAKANSKSYSIHFGGNYKFVLSKSDKCVYESVGIPIGMRCKVELKTDTVVITELTCTELEEVEVEEAKVKELDQNKTQEK